MYLFFDVETTGLPLQRNRTKYDLWNWPRMVQIAWLMNNEKGKIIYEKDAIIFPEGFQIPSDVVKIHGITTTIAKRKGEKLDQRVQKALFFDPYLMLEYLDHDRSSHFSIQYLK